MPGLPPITPDDVPSFQRWECEVCGTLVTMEEHGANLQPALGGYKQGRCPNHQCNSNTRKRQRGHAMFIPIVRITREGDDLVIRR
jgi:hypothetical protein